MRKRLWTGLAATAAAAMTLAACGGSSSSSPTTSGAPGGDSSTGGSSSTTTSTTSSSSAPASSGGTLKVVTGVAPESLDPGLGYTTQAIEADNMVYTSLLSYPAKEGVAGTQLIPGLAQALPTVSADKKTYSLKLRSGLTYSDGTKVKASDFTFAIERSLKIPWGGSGFYSSYIVGAADYGSGKADTINGITTNDTTGAITIKLTQPYGAFANLLAFPAAAPIPSTTSLKAQSNNPPVGVGPYKFGKIVPKQSYTLVKNPSFASFNIPNIPTGYVDEVDVTVNSNTSAEAQEVLTNQADIFDPADSIPAQLLAQVRTTASSRYKIEGLASTYYFFLNTQVAPFNNKQARLAVNMATDRTALAKLSAGSLTPACFFLPPTITGHQDGACSYGDPTQVPSADTVAKAKKMIADAGLAGTNVTVWSETRSPRQEFCTYFTQLLKQLGFNATLKVIDDAVYFPTIGNQSLEPQAGFADWSQDFPNPSDFYLLLSKQGIQKTNNENFGNVDDPTIESQLAKLEQVPASDLASSESGWKSLDTYVADQGYVVTYGYSIAPKFTSTRVAFDSAVFNSVDYLEYNTVQLTG